MAGSLEDYEGKRDFGRTPEPAPGAPAERGTSVFVVHRHEARRLHYDLRLEMNGVLKSWAVPKGFSYDPADKHLAVRTEDHPIEYETFEGMIPKGEYGAGTMTIWDHGRYRVLADGDPAAAVETGKFEVEMYGRRLRGEWHLVKTKQNWLMFKARDRHAVTDDLPALNMDLTAAEPAPLPARPRPMEPGESVEPFSDPGWLYEMKFVGRRVLVAKRPEGVRFVAARDGAKLAAALPRVMKALGAMRAESALLDGVLVALDRHGRPSAELLSQALGGDAAIEVQLYAFDLLYFDGFDLRELALLDRKSALGALLPPDPSLLYVDHVAGKGEDLLRSVAAAGLPGVIAKRSASRYLGGRSPDWREVAADASVADHDGSVEEALQGVASKGGRPTRVALTNLEKVYWPAEGYTKGDLLVYYEQVAEFLLPHLRGRPVHLFRWPDGIHGKNFYQQNAPDGCPDWVRTETIQRGHKENPIQQIVCDDRDTLLYLVNLGSIDIHPWMSSVGSLESPDWTVIDLDPKRAPFSDVVKIAREVGKLLRGIGLRPLLKTSGASGLHIYIPLVPGYTYDQARMFCEGVSRWIAKEHRDIATVERAIAGRGARVYVDFMQNRRGQTVVPPYAVRPVEGATISMPLDWDELTGDLHPSQFTIATGPPRLADRGDLFRPVLEDRQDLMPAIAALQDWLRG